MSLLLIKTKQKTFWTN